MAGRFARRVRGWAKGAGVPVVHNKSGDRNEDLARGYLPDDPGYEGVFAVIVRRAPGNVWDVEHTGDGRIRRIRRKVPRPWVNHYAFHIMDRDWGHVIIRFCPHPPFNALVILNGHEWVAKEAERRQLAFTKQDNCFTELSNARDLGLVADALSSPESSVGRLVQAPERWIYSAVLCFALDLADQERTGFRYHYSLFQAEYSRNLLFTSGQRMDRVFSALIDRVRGPLDLRTVKTLFGRRQRPRRHKGQPRAPVVEVSLETPEYDLTILRIRFRRLVLKIYTKGERVLRIEAMAHNARDLGCRLGASYFPEAVEALRQMVDRFIEVLDCLDATFIDAGLLDRLPRPGHLGRRPRRWHRHQPSSRPRRDAGPPRALPEPGGVHVLGTRRDGRPAPRRRTVLAEPRRLRPEEVPFQGVGRHDPAFTPIPRRSRSSACHGRAAPAPRQGRLATPRGGLHIQHRPQAPCQQRPGPTLRRCSSRDAKPLRHRWDRGLSRILNIFTMLSPQAA